MATANSAAAKSPEVLTGDDGGALQSYTFFFHSRIDSLSVPSHFYFLRSCAAMAIPGMGQG